MIDSRPTALPDGSVVHSDPEIMGGTPVFVGTRVPVQTLIDYLEGGYSLGEFIENFPSVRREQLAAFLEQATQALLAREPADDDLWPEYDFRSLRGVVRGKYAARYQERLRVVRLADDVAEKFETEAAVNQALREYLRGH